MTVKEILKSKGGDVESIGPHATLREALSRIVEQKVGALVVLDNTKALKGIITERDLMREVYQNSDLDHVVVADVMTRKVKVGSPDADVEEVEFAMTEGRFRHMPIMEDDRLVGLVSIGDMVKANLHKAKRQVDHLVDYIAGPMPA